jgi:hypothetical protein
MRSIVNQITKLLLCLILTASYAMAGSTQTYVIQLTDKDRDVRAKAAYELGCG